MILHPMVEDGKEAVGSMGDDTPLAVLSRQLSRLHHYFRQNFSQVTNPPIDSLRERSVMTPADPARQPRQHPRRGPEQSEMLSLQLAHRAPTPSSRRCASTWATPPREIDCTFDAERRAAMPCARPSSASASEAEDAVRARLPAHRADRRQRQTPTARAHADDPGDRRACIPTWCASRCAPSPRSTCARRECLDVHYFAVLIGVGATTVNAYLAQETIADRHAPRPVRRARRSEQCLRQLQEGARRGPAEGHVQDGHLGDLRPIAAAATSRRSACRARWSRSSSPACRRASPASACAACRRRSPSSMPRAFDEDVVALPIGGFYKTRRGGDRPHLRGQPHPHAAGRGRPPSPTPTYKQYSEAVRRLPPINLRDLLDFQPTARPMPLDEVESITEIRKRFVTPGISLGALGAGGARDAERSP